MDGIPAVNQPADLHDAALEAASAVIDGVPDGAWDGPTPCREWSVRAVVGHLAWGNQVLAAALGGAPFQEPAGGRTVPLRPPLPAAYRATVEEVRRALRSAGTVDTVAFPSGPVPLSAGLQTRVQDLVVHCWDIAVATGRTLCIDDELVRAAERTARERLAAGALSAGQFAPPGNVAAAASTLDRLLLTVGRDPRWRPSAG